MRTLSAIRCAALFWIAAAAFEAGACRHGARLEQHAIGNLTIGLAISPDPPVAGENHLLVSVAGASGRPIDGVTLGLTYDMPAMAAMPEMKGRGTVAARGSGRYDVRYALPTLGDWTITLAITPPGAGATTVTMKVSPPHPGFEFLGAAGPGGASLSAGAPRMGELGGLVVPFQQQQLIGVRYGAVERRSVSRTVRATGIVQVDETRLVDVALHYGGWIRELFVDKTGQPVRAGQPLFTIYSPELLTAQADYLVALRAAPVVRVAGGGRRVAQAAYERLRLLGLTAAQIDALASRGTSHSTVTVCASVSGIVLEKNVVAGMQVSAEKSLFRIGALGTVWVIADLHEYEAPLVSAGMPVRLTLPYGEGAQVIDGAVDYVYPTLDAQARTVRVRIALANAVLALKPGMYVDAAIDVPLGERTVVPATAVLFSGLHRYVFVDEGGGHLLPVELQLGPATSTGDVVVTVGLQPGQRVVISGNFLIDSDARLKNALPRWRKEAGDEGAGP